MGQDKSSSIKKNMKKLPTAFVVNTLVCTQTNTHTHIESVIAKYSNTQFNGASISAVSFYVQNFGNPSVKRGITVIWAS